METNMYIVRMVRAQRQDLLPRAIVVSGLKKNLEGKLPLLFFLLSFMFAVQLTGSSLVFNGSNSLVSFTKNDLQLTNNNQMVIGAWVNWSNKTAAQPGAVIFSVMDNTGNDGQFWLGHSTSNNSFQFSIKTNLGQKVTINSVTNPVAGNWYYVMGVFRDTSVELYVNGLREARISVAAGSLINPYNTNFRASVGNNLAATQGFNGTIDNIFLRNNFRADSAAVMNMMLIKMTGNETALYSYWSIDSLKGDSIYDAGINSSTGIYTNATVSSVEAPSGNLSSYIPKKSNQTSFVYYGFNHDSIVVGNFTPTIPAGIYFYTVYGAPSSTTTPSGVTVNNTQYYYGVFVPNYAGGSYSTTYYFHPAGTGKRIGYSTLSAPQALLERNSSSPVNWMNTGQVSSSAGTPFQVTSQSQWTELALGTLNSMDVHSNDLAAAGATYPNPFSSGFRLHLTCEKNTNLKVSLRSVNGTLVYEDKRSCLAGENDLEFGNLGQVAGGVYFLTVADESNGVANFKMIKN